MSGYTVPKGIKTVIEVWTPERAAKVLEDLNEGNRNVSWDHVTSLVNEIRRGNHQVTHQGVAFGRDGKLYDGQHRLWAVVKSGVAVPMLTTYGLPPESRDAIDKGRKRSTADELKMRFDVTNSKKVAAFTLHCANLYAKYHNAGRVQVATGKTLLEWYDVFRPGVDFALAFEAGAAPALRRAGVAGTLAFAHRAMPTKIEEFADRVRAGVGLKRNEPAWALRRALLEGQHAQRFGAAQYSSMETSRRVMQAALSHIRSEELHKIADGVAGLKYFGKAYDDSRKARSLLKPFTDSSDDPKVLTENQSAALAASVTAKAKS